MAEIDQEVKENSKLKTLSLFAFEEEAHRRRQQPEETFYDNKNISPRLYELSVFAEEALHLNDEVAMFKMMQESLLETNARAAKERASVQQPPSGNGARKQPILVVPFDSR
jgi:hypothetical protein